MRVASGVGDEINDIIHRTKMNRKEKFMKKKKKTK